MSEEIKNQYCHENDPTNLDLHIEQTRQAVILEQLSDDVGEIKDVLVGKDRREGLVADVDRLKQSRARATAIIWLVFTTIIGTTATALYAAFFSN